MSHAQRAQTVAKSQEPNLQHSVSAKLRLREMGLHRTGQKPAKRTATKQTAAQPPLTFG
jgi:hypothetical protein